MKIVSIDYCWDGGSALIHTNNENQKYWVDRSIDTWESDQLPDIWDDEPPSKSATKVNEIRGELIAAIQNFDQRGEMGDVLVADLKG